MAGGLDNPAVEPPGPGPGERATVASDPAVAPPAQQPLAIDRDINGAFELALRACADFSGSGTRVAISSAEVLTRKPGQRCVIRYSWTTPAGTPASLIGKLYRRRRLAIRAYERMRELREVLGEDGRAIPTPLALVPELGLLLQEDASGRDLRHALAAGSYRRPLAATGQWLAHLHRGPSIPGLRNMCPAHEVEKLSGWCAEIARELSRADEAALGSVLDELSERSADLPAGEAHMIHKDFYYANLLWDGSRIRVLDFDEMSLGDPAFDVAHFSARVEMLRLQRPGNPQAFADAIATFRKGYRRAGGQVGSQHRIHWYRAYTFVKVAASEVRGKRGDWRTLAHGLVRLAQEAVREAS